MGLFYGPYRSYGYGYSLRDYVVAEKRGSAITWTVFSQGYQTYDKVAQLREEAAGIEKANALIRKEVEGLRSEANRLKAAVSQDDSAGKEELQVRLATAQQAIQAKEGAINPGVIWVVSGPYYSRSQLDNYLLRVEKETWAAKAR